MSENRIGAGPLQRLQRFGISVPEILLPREDIPLEKFAVIACDQHSAEPEYWEETEKIVGDTPSSLRLMLPEAWLSRKEELEPKINQTMDSYLQEGILQPAGCGLVYVRRQVGEKADGTPLIRHGLVAAIDLTCYDYVPGNHNRIRATEATVKERLPERIHIREKASLEMPHVLVMLDDEENRLTQLLESRKDQLRRLYDFDLMQDGGHIEGYFIDSEEDLQRVADVMKILDQKCEDGFLMAVGDGNHSLAAAKETFLAHPENPLLRYALVELISVYDEGLSFHPIHRLLMNLDPADIPEIKRPWALTRIRPRIFRSCSPPWMSGWSPTAKIIRRPSWITSTEKKSAGPWEKSPEIWPLSSTASSEAPSSKPSWKTATSCEKAFPWERPGRSAITWKAGRSNKLSLNYIESTA